MLATLLPISTLVKLVHSLNAEMPILVRLSGIVILVKPVQSSNALSAIHNILSFIV